MTAYDEVAYPSLPLPQTQPDRFATQAALHGTRSQDPAACRVLEIGCSDAGNLTWLAAYAPGSTFLGVDLSETAVTRARELSTSVPNIEVRQDDLTQLDAGEFDFVIAHGVYSWLPDPSALLACVDRHLAPDGVAYVSYNTMPGCHVRQMAGDPLRRFTAGRSDRLAAARALLEWMSSAGAESGESPVYTELMRRAAQLAAAKPDALLVHDDLAAHNRSVYLDEFVADAAAHGLAYLGECHLSDSEPPDGTALPDWLAAEVGDDEVARQQVLDYVRNRAFRQTLLVRPGNAPQHHQVDPARLDSLWASAPVERGASSAGRTTYALNNGVQLTTDGGDLVADLERLGAAWPRAVSVAELTTDRAVLLRIHAARGLELRVRPTPAVMPGDRPLVTDLARLRARVDGAVVSARHEMLQLEDPLTREAVALCDGGHSRAAIAATLALRPGAPVDSRQALDGLLEGLGLAGLMLA